MQIWIFPDLDFRGSEDPDPVKLAKIGHTVLYPALQDQIYWFLTDPDPKCKRFFDTGCQKRVTNSWITAAASAIFVYRTFVRGRSLKNSTTWNNCLNTFGTYTELKFLIKKITGAEKSTKSQS